MRTSGPKRLEGVLAGCGAEESALAILPSVRVCARTFLNILRENGMQVRVLGLGSAQVVDAVGRRARVGGVIIAAARTIEVRKLQARAQLCGVTVAPVTSA